MALTAESYAVLGLDPSASDEALHDAYRRLVKAAHPDLHGGTAEATCRFVRVQVAYDEIMDERRGPRGSTPRPAAADPGVEARLADLEREVRVARVARERAAAAARDALREVQDEVAGSRPPAEEEDSFTRLLADTAAELRERVARGREHPTVKRAEEMLAGLEWLASTTRDTDVRGRRDGAGRQDGKDRSSGEERRDR